MGRSRGAGEERAGEGESGRRGEREKGRTGEREKGRKIRKIEKNGTSGNMEREVRHPGRKESRSC